MKKFDLSSHADAAIQRLTLVGNIITFAGDYGNLNIDINGHTKVATFDQDLTTTADNFVAANYDYYRAHGFILTADTGVITVTPASGWETVNNIVVTTSVFVPEEALPTTTIHTTTGGVELTATISSTLEVDFLKARIWKIDFDTALAVANPVNAKDGDRIRIELNTANSSAVTWGSAWTFYGEQPESATVNVIEGVYDAVTAKVIAAVASASASVGADPTPVSRTNNPIVGTAGANSNIDKLDAAIGADLSPLTRTKGPVSVANTVNQNLDALDTAIGADSDIPGNAKNIAASSSIIANLASVDRYKTVRTIKKTIGAPGLAGVDFNFTSAANQSEQVIDLGAIIPAKARLVDIFVHNDAVFTGATSMAADVGTTSGGNELITSGTIYAAGAIIAAANAGAFIATPSGSSTHVYLNATPGANWDQFTAGSVSVFITIIDVTGI